MAKGVFSELTTAFLRAKLTELETRWGRQSEAYLALARQYLKSPHEEAPTEESNVQHYEADVATPERDQALPGIERLYRRTLVIKPTLACAAHCRYCIRTSRSGRGLSERELREIAEYCGSPAHRDDLTEVLITGGDALLVPQRIEYLLQALIQYAPNIIIVRIASRMPTQDPDRIDGPVLRLFENKPSLRLELATQINHSVELFPESVEALGRIMRRGVTVFAQNVLLRGVNDDVNVLIDLYDAMRQIGIEAHYLFHCVPIEGTAHLRTSLQEALELTRGLTCSGNVTGRAKPILTVMTDIGKIILYDGAILERRNRDILFQSHYRLDDRRRWNPGWQLPRTAEVDRQGRLREWYLDGPEQSHGADDGLIPAHTPARRFARGLAFTGPSRLRLEEPATAARH